MARPSALLGWACALLLLAGAALGEDILIKARRGAGRRLGSGPPAQGCSRRRRRLCRRAQSWHATLPPPRPLVQGGTVVNADRQFRADVLIRDGLILRVGPDLQARPGGGGWAVVDASCDLGWHTLAALLAV